MKSVLRKSIIYLILFDFSDNNRLEVFYHQSWKTRILEGKNENYDLNGKKGGYDPEVVNWTRTETRSEKFKRKEN